MSSEDMNSASADSRKSSRRRHPKTSKKPDGSCASQASSSSAGSSLASSRVSTPSIATNASSTSAGMVAASSSSTSAMSDLPLKFQYDRDLLIDLKSARLSHVRPAGLSSDHETDEGVWDPDRWFGSVCTNMAESSVREKRKQPGDVDIDAGVRKRPSGNGSKSAGAAAEADNDDEHISLAPQRSSFLSGCQVKRSAAGPDSKRDGRDRRDAARIGSGRIQISDRLADKEQRKDGRYDRHRDGYEKGEAGDRRRTDRDADDLGRGRYSRDVDNGFPNRLERDEGFRSDRYDRDDSRAGKSRVDRDRDDAKYDSRRKDGSFRNKNDYMDRRDGDRRATKGSGYNYEASGGSYGRGYAAAEPEWYTEGPVSQSDTIELHGFDGAHGERLQTQNTSDDGDNSRLEDQRVRAARRSKDDRAGRSGTVKDKDSSSNRSQNETCDTMPNTVLDEKNERRSDELDACQNDVSNIPVAGTNDPTMSSQNTSEFDFNEFFRIDSAALGLGLDGLPGVNSTSSSRLWKWSGRLYADDTLQTASTNDDTVTKTSQHGDDGAAGELSGLIDTKALLSLLQKSDQQTPSLPSLYLDSRLAPQTAVGSPATQGKVVANVQALLDSACQPTSAQPVLPSGGKIVRLEELEASQLSPLGKQPLIPSGSSTPADSAASSSAAVNVSRDSGSVLADTRRQSSAPGTGPAHGHIPPGPAPALPAGAQVQTLEEIEAGVRTMNIPSSSPVNHPIVSTSAGGGDLSAFNKLLHLVNKSQPVTDQAQAAVKSVQQEVTSSADNASAVAAASTAVTLVSSNISELPQAGMPVSMPVLQHPNPAAIDNSSAMHQQKIYQLHQQQQQQLYLQQQMMMKDPQLLMAYLQQLPSQPQQQPGNISPQILQQHLRSYSPRAPSPIMFGSQPPISVAAPMPIHSRQRLPLANVAPPPMPPQLVVGMQQSTDAMHLAAVHSVIQKQLQQQKQRLQQPPVMLPTDRNAAVSAGLLPASQLPNSVATATRTTGASFIPTSVIRNMVGQRTVDDRHLKDGDVVSVNEGQNVVKDSIIRLDSTAAAAAVGGGGGGSLRPTMDGIVNGPTSYPFTDHPAVDSAILSSPNSRQQLSEQNKSRRPLIGQGMMNAADAPAAAAAAAANYGTLPQSVTHTPVGRPIVKGQTPFNVMGLSSSSVAGVPGAGNCLTVEQLQLMSHLAQQHQQQQRPVHPALEAMLGTHGQLLAGFMQQPPPVNNAAVKPQPQLRAGGQQCMPVRQLMQAGVRPLNNQIFMDNADKHPDAVARLLASGVGDHRLPNIPAQLAKTVDEIECAVPPAAN